MSMSKILPGIALVAALTGAGLTGAQRASAGERDRFEKGDRKNEPGQGDRQRRGHERHDRDGGDRGDRDERGDDMYGSPGRLGRDMPWERADPFPERHGRHWGNRWGDDTRWNVPNWRYPRSHDHRGYWRWRHDFNPPWQWARRVRLAQQLSDTAEALAQSLWQENLPPRHFGVRGWAWRFARAAGAYEDELRDRRGTSRAALLRARGYWKELDRRLSALPEWRFRETFEAAQRIERYLTRLSAWSERYR